MSTGTDTIRRFQLRKHGLEINIARMTGLGQVFFYWEVRNGGAVAARGTVDGDRSILAMLKHVADNTTLRTDAGNVALRSLTWEALDGHEHVPASELRAGDVLCVNGYGLTIESATPDGDNMIIITAGMGYHGSAGTRRCYRRNQLCNLAERSA